MGNAFVGKNIQEKGINHSSIFWTHNGKEIQDVLCFNQCYIAASRTFAQEIVLQAIILDLKE